MQRQVIEASTDILLITDLSLPGVRDAMRLQQLAHDVSPQAKLYLATSGVADIAIDTILCDFGTEFPLRVFNAAHGFFHEGTHLWVELIPPG